CFFQAEDGIRDFHVTGVQTCALPIWSLLWNDYTSDRLRHNVDRIVGDAVRVLSDLRDVGYRPPQFAGPLHSPVLMVGQARSTHEIGRASCRERVEDTLSSEL